MRKAISILIVVVLLLITSSSSAEGYRLGCMLGCMNKDSNITLEIRYDQLSHEIIHSLRLCSKDRKSEITIETSKRNLIGMNLKNFDPVDCKANYYTNMSFGFDSEERFTIPFYCPESPTNFAYDFTPSNVKKLIHYLRRHRILRVRFFHNTEITTFNLKGFMFVYDFMLDLY